MSSGIYKWTNKETGNIYIGQAQDLQKRQKQFLNFNNSYAGEKINEERRLYPSLKYWDYDILEECNPEQLNAFEKYYIAKYDNTILLNIDSVITKYKTKKSKPKNSPQIKIVENKTNKNKSYWEMFFENVAIAQKNLIMKGSHHLRDICNIDDIDVLYNILYNEGTEIRKIIVINPPTCCKFYQLIIPKYIYNKMGIYTTKDLRNKIKKIFKPIDKWNIHFNEKILNPIDILISSISSLDEPILYPEPLYTFLKPYSYNVNEYNTYKKYNPSYQGHLIQEKDKL